MKMSIKLILIVLSVLLVLTSLAQPTDHITNGNFETGDLTGWTPSDTANTLYPLWFIQVIMEGTCLSFSSHNDTTGIPLEGDYAAYIQPTQLPPIASTALITSDPFIAGTTVRFDALVNDDSSGNAVNLEVRLLDSSGNILLSQGIIANSVLVDAECPGSGSTIYTGDNNSVFSTHVIDTSAFTGQIVRIEFRQNNNNSDGRAEFVLIDDVISESATPEAAVSNLIDMVIDMNLQQGISNSLDAKLGAVSQTLADMNQNNDVAAINNLNAFINAVEAQRGGKLTDEQANTLIAAAQAIIELIND